MKTIEQLSLVSAVMYALAAGLLAAIAVGMMALAVLDIWQAYSAGARLDSALLDSVGLVIVAVAVIDVSKYLMEEGVVRRQELRAPGEARAALTKFLSIIIMAIALETLMFVFDSGRTSMRDLVYPAVLLFAVILAPVALGLFQLFSRKAEAISGKDQG